MFSFEDCLVFSSHSVECPYVLPQNDEQTALFSLILWFGESVVCSSYHCLGDRPVPLSSEAFLSIALSCRGCVSHSLFPIAILAGQCRRLGHC